MDVHPSCIVCGLVLPGSHSHRKYCSTRCKATYRRQNPNPPASEGHHCRVCGKHFPIGPGQYNKWICSPECRRASNAKSVREFHLRRPAAEARYRERTKSKGHVDSRLVRFYRVNPEAPRACQSCGEDRVLDVAHRPECPRLGERMNNGNILWPSMVWVLCPTCHALLDRKGYEPSELGLS